MFYCLTIAFVVHRNPSLAPEVVREKIEAKARPWWPKVLAALILGAVAVQFLRGGLGWAGSTAFAALAVLVAIVDVAVMPAIVIALVVVGGIYGGIFTPTEGAAVGAITTLLVGVAQRTLGWRDILQAIRQTAETAGMIFIILLGAEVFGAFMARSQLPITAAEMIGGSGLSPYAVLIAMLAFYILLGAVMDELAMILLTLPVFFPVIQGLEFGMSPDDVAIWFGILVLVVVGIGLTAPPIGLNVFVISSLAKGIPIASTYRGVLPFLAADVIRLAIFLVFPAVALWLVHLLS